MKAVQQLRDLGYSFQVNGVSIDYTFHGDTAPDPEVVNPLLKEISDRKNNALEHLTKDEPIPRWKEKPIRPDEVEGVDYVSPETVLEGVKV